MKTKNVLRRSNVVGSRLTDRFGLQQMYQKRKQALERPTWLAPEKEPVTVVGIVISGPSMIDNFSWTNWMILISQVLSI